MTISERAVNGSVHSNNVEHAVKGSATKNELFIEVQNMKSGDFWRATFTADYVENITSKTGNFKQYSTFVDMFWDATRNLSNSVELELLTYSDLVSLKTGKISTKSSTDSKRYLILTYKDKYDTVHYPLPLQYAGKTNSVELQENVTKLQREIDRLKAQIVSSAPSPRKLVSPQIVPNKSEDTVKEKVPCKHVDSTTVRSLQSALRNLEGDMVREKNKYQRALDKKGQECQRLIDEVEKLRRENRTLTVKLRSVTTELNLSKRTNFSYRSRSINSNRSTPNAINRQSRPRSAPLRSSESRRGWDSNGRSSSRGSAASHSRERTTRDRHDQGTSRKRSTSRNSSTPEIRTRARTPSPAGARFPRFDPSAYVHDKERKIKEKQAYRAHQTKSRTYLPRARSSPLERQHHSTSIYHKPPTSSIVKEIIANNLVHGRRSGSASSLDSYHSNHSNHSNGSNRRRPNKKQRSAYSYPSSDSDNAYRRKKRTPYLNASPTVEFSLDRSNMSFTKDSEIAEIDARLNALQSYLKAAQNKNYAS